MTQDAARWTCGLLLTCVVACGSRSDLLDANAVGSSGGASSGGGSSGGASSGGASTGGAVSVSPCRKLSIASRVLTPKQTGVTVEDGLRLTASSDDGLQFTAAWVRKQGDDFFMRHSTLRPWDDWPADGVLGPVFEPQIQPQSAYAVGRGVGASWAAAVRFGDSARLYRKLDPLSGASFETPIELPTIAPFLVSRAADGESHLVGIFDVSPAQQLRGFSVDAAGAVAELAPFGCSSGQPPRAAAVPFGDHWLVVASRSGNFETCPSAQGPPTRLDVLDVPRTGAYTTLATDTDGFTIIDASAAPHPKGVYAVWTSSLLGTTVHALRVDAVTKAITGPAILVQTELSNGVTIGAVGDQLVLLEKTGFSSLRASVFDPDLNLAAKIDLSTGFPPRLGAVLGAPSGEGFVLAWTEQATSKFSVHLARVDCSR